MSEKFVWYQQGDVTIQPVASIPVGAEERGGRVLREGEATGHAHRAASADVRLFILDGRLYLHAPSGTEVVHEEHRALTLPPGDYLIGAVREYDHFAERAHEVWD